MNNFSYEMEIEGEKIIVTRAFQEEGKTLLECIIEYTDMEIKKNVKDD